MHCGAWKEPCPHCSCSQKIMPCCLMLHGPAHLQVGLELLQHAVTWGLPSLASRLLEELMAAPLSLPFRSIAGSGAGEPLPARLGQQGSGSGTPLLEHPQQLLQHARDPPNQCASCWPAGMDAVEGEKGAALLTAAAAPPHPSDPPAAAIVPLSSVGAGCTELASSGMLPPSLLFCALVSRHPGTLERVLEWGAVHGHTWDQQAADASFGCTLQQVCGRWRRGAWHALVHASQPEPACAV